MRIFYFITLFNIDDIFNFFDDFADLVGDIFKNVIEVFVHAFDALYTFLVGLYQQEEYMQGIIDQIDSGVYEGVNLVTIIGSYHYLVGDLLFYYTYLVLMFGSAFMIYRMLLIIYSFLKSIVSNGSTKTTQIASSLASKITSIFK